MKVMKIMNNIKLLAKPCNNKNYNNALGTIHIFLIRNFFIRNSQMANELSVLKTMEVKKLITFSLIFFITVMMIQYLTLIFRHIHKRAFPWYKLL